MSRQRIAHDSAWHCARSIIECLDVLFRDEEKRDGFEAVYERVRAAIEAALQQYAREMQRLHPS